MFFDTNLKEREREEIWGAIKIEINVLTMSGTVLDGKGNDEKVSNGESTCVTSGSFEQLVGNLFLSIDDVLLPEFRTAVDR